MERWLCDAVLPRSLAEEAPPGVEFLRWTGADTEDAPLVYEAARRGCRGVMLYEKDSLEQTGLHEAAIGTGLTLVAVDARDPIEAKSRIVANWPRLRRMAALHDTLLVLARQVRPYPE